VRTAVLGFLIAAVLVYVLTPLMGRLANRTGAVDTPSDDRRMHVLATPLLGGLGMYLGWMIPVMILVKVDRPVWGIIGGATIVVAVGLFDDLYELEPIVKFMGQLLAIGVAIYFDIPINSPGAIAIFAVVGLLTIGFVWRGMHAMSFLQSWGFPIFLVLFAWGLWQLANNHDPVGPSGWHATAPLTLAAMMNALSFANGQMIFQGLMATDYGRFAAKEIRYRGTATIMLLELIPMFAVIFLGCFIGASLLGELTGPNAQANAQDPGFMFVHIMGLSGVLFVLITQIRINVMNLYGGSIALASGFEVAAHFRPGRPWWMFFVWFFGVVFYATNVINHLGTFLAITGVLTNTWVLIILADYFVCRRMLGLGRSENIEFHENEVRRWNPTGLVSLGVAVFVGALGIAEVYPIYFASFAAMILGPILHVALTMLTKGKYYAPDDEAYSPVDEAALDAAR